jgi:hypothetical protein
MGSLAETVSDVLFGRPEQPDIPEAEIPAAPAPSTREDTGANIIVGSDKSKDRRVSGGVNSSSSQSGADVLSGLGKGGLSI